MDIQGAISVAVPFIEGWEGFEPAPYYDTNGYAIGYGNHYYEDGSPVTADDDPITQGRAEQLLTFYVQQNAAAIAAQVTQGLNINELAALTSLRYNCGTITNAVLNLVNSGADPATVAAQIEQTCTTSGGVTNQDLILRRQAEAGLYQQSPGTSLLPILIVAAVALYLLSHHKPTG